MSAAAASTGHRGTGPVVNPWAITVAVMIATFKEVPYGAIATPAELDRLQSECMELRKVQLSGALCFNELWPRFNFHRAIPPGLLRPPLATRIARRQGQSLHNRGQ
jgi:hypothetical protein